MKYFEWSDELNTDVGTIDAQHREFGRRVNRFLDACVGDTDDSEALRETFHFLADYAAEHLELEETLMREYDYPRRDEHESQHARFRTFVKESILAMRHPALPIDFTMSVNYMLVDWFQSHIRGVDKPLTAFLHEVAKTRKPPKLVQLIQGIFGTGDGRKRH